ncbi:MAG: hypothetical protein JJU02_14840 [Cryomorphaceae bacterium]|nr:hypothetical protein [Cryomorphaceae bacterium]
MENSGASRWLLNVPMSGGQSAGRNFELNNQQGGDESYQKDKNSVDFGASETEFLDQLLNALNQIYGNSHLNLSQNDFFDFFNAYRNFKVSAYGIGEGSFKGGDIEISFTNDPSQMLDGFLLYFPANKTGKRE